MSHDTAPAMVGRYRLEHKLGEGGMGVVWAAHDPQLDRAVAIKMIRQDAGGAAGGPDTSQARARLMREARAAASVSHPNICPIHEVGESNGDLYLVMELLEGETLGERIARGPMPLGEAAEVALGVLSALEALHRRGVVHRDLKPNNVFLTPHGVRLLDFGLARPTQADLMRTMDLQATMPGQLVGTPRYMAPEQWAGGEVTASADLFATGALLYEMLAGRPAYAGSTMVEVYHAIMHERAPTLAGGPAVKAVDRTIQRALARQAAERHPDAASMARELREALLMMDSGAPPRVQTLRRLIVLPFRLLRPDPEVDFLSFSLPDAITVSLTGADGLVVRSSIAASRFAGEAPDLRQIANEAEVDMVLTGTLMRAGDQVRVNCQLVEAPAGTLVWSKAAQVPLGDLFQLQDDLVQQIVASVAGPLAGTRESIPGRRDVPANARAFELFLRANELARDPRQWLEARDVYRACLDADSEFAPAWARYARVCRVIAKYELADHAEHVRAAGEAFQRVFALNPDLSIGHNLYTNFEVEEKGDPMRAIERLLNRARDRDNDPDLYAGLVLALRYGGLMEASIAADRQARRLDPTVPTSVEYTHFMSGDYVAALASSRDPTPYMQTYALAMLGREEESLGRLHELEQIAQSPFLVASTQVMRAAIEMNRDACLVAHGLLATSNFRDPEGIYFMGRALARVGLAEQALATMARVVDGGFYALSTFASDPWLDPIRGRSEFRALVARVDARRREAIGVYERCDGEKLLGVRAR